MYGTGRLKIRINIVDSDPKPGRYKSQQNKDDLDGDLERPA
jgi:hypothetical protein